MLAATFKLGKAAIGAAIGLGTALAAATPVLVLVKADELDIAILLAGPLIIINTIVAAFASGERLRVVTGGSLGTGAIYLVLALLIASDNDPFAILTISGVGGVAAAIAWSISISFERLIQRRQRLRMLTGRCANCGYDCDGLTICPECGSNAAYSASAATP